MSRLVRTILIILMAIAFFALARWCEHKYSMRRQEMQHSTDVPASMQKKFDTKFLGSNGDRDLGKGADGEKLEHPK